MNAQTENCSCLTLFSYSSGFVADSQSLRYFNVSTWNLFALNSEVSRISAAYHLWNLDSWCLHLSRRCQRSPGALPLYRKVIEESPAAASSGNPSLLGLCSVSAAAWRTGWHTGAAGCGLGRRGLCHRAGAGNAATERRSLATGTLAAKRLTQNQTAELVQNEKGMVMKGDVAHNVNGD